MNRLIHIMIDSVRLIDGLIDRSTAISRTYTRNVNLCGDDVDVVHKLGSGGGQKDVVQRIGNRFAAVEVERHHENGQLPVGAQNALQLFGAEQRFTGGDATDEEVPPARLRRRQLRQPRQQRRRRGRRQHRRRRRRRGQKTMMMRVMMTTPTMPVVIVVDAVFIDTIDVEEMTPPGRGDGGTSRV